MQAVELCKAGELTSSEVAMALSACSLLPISNDEQREALLSAIQNVKVTFEYAWQLCMAWRLCIHGGYAYMAVMHVWRLCGQNIILWPGRIPEKDWCMFPHLTLMFSPFCPAESFLMV